jgi:hypothetical protein
MSADTLYPRHDQAGWSEAYEAITRELDFDSIREEGPVGARSSLRNRPSKRSARPDDRLEKGAPRW